MQHEKSTVPVVPFALNDYSAKEPTEFEFDYIIDGVKYWYSFVASNGVQGATSGIKKQVV